MIEVPSDRYVRACRVVGVVDGDTIDVDVDLGMRLTLTSERLRLFGIDTPERNDRDPHQRALALEATGFVRDWCRHAEVDPIDGDPDWPLRIRTIQVKRRTTDWERGKYGRLLARVYRADGSELAQALLDAGKAVRYLR